MEAVKQDNLILNNCIKQIEQELSEKAPALQKLRRDYDGSLKTIANLNSKLDGVMDECERLRLEGEDSVRQYQGVIREKQRLKALTTDLGQQIKVKQTNGCNNTTYLHQYSVRLYVYLCKPTALSLRVS